MNNAIRVLHVVTHMNRGGLETMIMNYYRHINREKVQFDFLVHRNGRADYDDEIESMGGKIYRFPRLIPWSPSYKKKLHAFFLAHSEYHIVHVHQDCLSSVILREAQKCDIPVRIAHSHSTSQDKDWKYLVKLFYKRSIPKYATTLFACGKNAGEWMFGGAAYKVLNNAIDAAAYRYNDKEAATVRKRLGIREDDFVVGHVGRFSPPKNHKFLIDIFSCIAKKDMNTRLLLVGDGQLRPDIEKRVEILGLRDKVIFTGVQKDVDQMMQAMDAFVFPSLYEGLGIVAVEAQASGLPCFISSDVPGDCIITDLVRVISRNDSPEYWADKILEARKEKRCSSCSEVVHAGYDIAENAKWLQNYYLAQQKAGN